MPAIVNRDECVGCGTCVEECPEEAVSLDDEEISVVDSKTCTECGTCVEACPAEAISIDGEEPRPKEINVGPAFELRHTLQGHKSTIYRMALSHDGRILASSSFDRTVRLWDVESGRSLPVLEHGKNSAVCVAWSPMEHTLASSDGVPNGKTVYLWDGDTGKILNRLGGHTDRVISIAWSPDGKTLAAGSDDNNIMLWDAKTGQRLHELRGDLHSSVNGLAWSPDGSALCSSSGGDSIRLWDAATGDTLRKFNIIETRSIPRPDLFSTLPADTTIRCIAWSQDGRCIASGCDDRTVRIWDPLNGQQTHVLEGHNEGVVSLSFWDEGRLLASLGYNGEMIIWRTDTWTQVMDVAKIGASGYLSNLAIHPMLPVIAACGRNRNEINIWHIDLDMLLAGQAAPESVRYATAKLVLAGDSGVGKTGLVWRLAHGRLFAWENLPGTDDQRLRDFLRKVYNINLGVSEKIVKSGDSKSILIPNGDKTLSLTLEREDSRVILKIDDIRTDCLLAKKENDELSIYEDLKDLTSTHGQHFWIIDELRTKRQDGTECQGVLWDIAGQHTYRPVHAIFLDNVDLALVLFDPTNRQEPLKGVVFWLEQLAGKKRLPPSVLVGGRLDRGTLALSQDDIDQFCQLHGISGGYIGTSAKNVIGIDKLLSTIKTLISWEQMTTTVTTATFKRVKDFVLDLKEMPNRKGFLVSPEDLRRQLQSKDPTWQFTDAEMMTAVRHLENHGYVTMLTSSSGKDHILLNPELLINLASSIILQAGNDLRGLGSLNEDMLLKGKYGFQELAKELANLEEKEKHALLEAAEERFLEHNICFREKMGDENLLIFPEYITQKRPQRDEADFIEDVSYVVRGRVENVYSALVVLLGYTNTIKRVGQWQNQAQYEIDSGEICGFRQISEREGEIELVLYYSTTMPNYGRMKFQGTFEDFLRKQQDVRITCFPPQTCPNPECHHSLNRAIVVQRMREHKEFLFCENCGRRVDLPKIEEPLVIGAKESGRIKKEDAIAGMRSLYEAQLVRIKGSRRDRAVPRCYISHMPEEAGWVLQLAHDLINGGVYILKREDKIQESDFVVLVGTTAYRDAWDRAAEFIKTDADLIRQRIEADEPWPTIIPLLREGKSQTAFPWELKGRTEVDFRDEMHYFVSLFDLMLALHAIPINDEAFKPCRQALNQQWRRTSSEIGEGEPQEESENALEEALELIRSHDSVSKRPSCFICYAWGVQEHEKWVEKLASGLKKAEIDVVLDRWHNEQIGDNIARFISKISESDSVIVVGTPQYLKKFKNESSKKGCIVAAEADLFLQRLAGTEDQKKTVRPIILEGDEETSLPDSLRGRVFADFRQKDLYISSLIDLVLSIYGIPFQEEDVQELRDRLKHEQTKDMV